MIEALPDRLEKDLSEILRPDEQVLVKIKGAFKEGLICTDSRVIVLKGGFMTGQTFGNNVFQSNYHNIAGVEVKFHLLSGYFELSAGGMQNTDKRFWSNNKNSDPAKAPNCISLNRKEQKTKFQEACAIITEMVNKSHTTINAPVVQPANVKEDVLTSLEKLSQLKDAGIITQEEFQAKKEELLARL